MRKFQSSLLWFGSLSSDEALVAQLISCSTTSKKMPSSRLSVLVAALALCWEPLQAFVPPPVTAAAPPTSNSRTALALFEMFNEGKKLLVKKLAGDYDEVAVQARLDSLVSENPVLMLSFVT